MKPAPSLTIFKFSKNLLVFTFFMLTMALPSLIGAADRPDPKPITDELSCGVCGMYPAKFPEWQTQIIFTDGKMVPFDGSKDMFKFILDTTKYDPDHSGGDIAAIWVKEFNTGNWLDGKKAAYVVGSEIMGPMGKELIPFENKETAEEFQKVNGGMIKEFADISMDEIKKLGMEGMKMKGNMQGKM